MVGGRRCWNEDEDEDVARDDSGRVRLFGGLPLPLAARAAATAPTSAETGRCRPALGGDVLDRSAAERCRSRLARALAALRTEPVPRRAAPPSSASSFSSTLSFSSSSNRPRGRLPGAGAAERRSPLLRSVGGDGLGGAARPPRPAAVRVPRAAAAADAGRAAERMGEPRSSKASIVEQIGQAANHFEANVLVRRQGRLPSPSQLHAARQGGHWAEAAAERVKDVASRRLCCAAVACRAILDTLRCAPRVPLCTVPR